MSDRIDRDGGRRRDEFCLSWFERLQWVAFFLQGWGIVMRFYGVSWQLYQMGEPLLAERAEKAANTSERVVWARMDVALGRLSPADYRLMVGGAS